MSAPVLRNSVSGEIRALDKAHFFELFDDSVHDALEEAIKRYPTAVALVCFENLDLNSSQLGARTALVVGPDNSYNIDSLATARLGDVPSRFQYPTAIFYLEGGAQ